MNPRIHDSYRTQQVADGRWGVWRKQMGRAGHSTFVGYGATREEARKIVTADRLRRSRKIRP